MLFILLWNKKLYLTYVHATYLKKKVTNYFKKMLLFFVLVCMSTSTCDVWFSSIRGVGDSAHSFVPALALALSFRWKLMLWRDNFILYLSLAWRDELCWLAPWAPILSNLAPKGISWANFHPWQAWSFCPQCPRSKSDPNYSPLKKLKRLEKIGFQHTTITLGLVNK